MYHIKHLNASSAVVYVSRKSLPRNYSEFYLKRRVVGLLRSCGVKMPLRIVLDDTFRRGFLFIDVKIMSKVKRDIIVLDWEEGQDELILSVSHVIDKKGEVVHPLFNSRTV